MKSEGAEKRTKIKTSVNVVDKVNWKKKKKKERSSVPTDKVIQRKYFE